MYNLVATFNRLIPMNWRTKFRVWKRKTKGSGNVRLVFVKLEHGWMWNIYTHIYIYIDLQTKGSKHVSSY